MVELQVVSFHVIGLRCKVVAQTQNFKMRSFSRCGWVCGEDKHGFHEIKD